MPPLRTLNSRPTIRELSSFLFSASADAAKRQQRCLSSSTITKHAFPVLHHQSQNHHTSRPYLLSSTNPNLTTNLNPNLPSLHRPSSSSSSSRSTAPRTHDRGPTSTEDTQTDFGTLDVLGATPRPSTSIDACLWDGFHLDNGVKIKGAGALLVAGEAFQWCPWRAAGDGELRMVNATGQWEVGGEDGEDGVWGVLELVWPKPDLLILGLGKEMRPLSEKTRRRINALGIRVDVQDTRNAAAQYNLLATERGIQAVAAALIPLGWKEGIGIK